MPVERAECRIVVGVGHGFSGTLLLLARPCRDAGRPFAFWHQEKLFRKLRFFGLLLCSTGDRGSGRFAIRGGG